MQKTKKAEAGVKLRRGQLKRIGRLEAKNPDRAERVAGRMTERATRVQRGKSFVQNLATKPKMKKGGAVSKTSKKK